MNIQMKTGRRARWLALAPVKATLLVACGGGSGSSATASSSVNRKMVPAFNGGVTANATPIEPATVSSGNFKQMNTWFASLMGDSFA
jgi:hypothetical protein